VHSGGGSVLFSEIASNTTVILQVFFWHTLFQRARVLAITCLFVCFFVCFDLFQLGETLLVNLPASLSFHCRPNLKNEIILKLT